MMNKIEEEKKSYRQRLREYLTEHLTITGLRAFCFDEEIPDADFSQSSLNVFVIELLQMLFATKRVHILIKWLKEKGYFPPES